jgi:hypothetical protein
MTGARRGVTGVRHEWSQAGNYGEDWQGVVTSPKRYEPPCSHALSVGIPHTPLYAAGWLSVAFTTAT